MSSQDSKLQNTYVEKYYDAQLKNTHDEYEQSRWKSSPVRRFEYEQTKRALLHALGSKRYLSAVEVGPGSAVWTPFICAVSNSVHLIEQSEEMLNQARTKLGEMGGVTLEHNDASQAKLSQPVNLVVAIRCFEYFENKQKALENLHSFLVEDGQLILITKNAGLIRKQPLKKDILHSDQKTFREMIDLLSSSGFVLERACPAVLRLGAKYAVARLVFDILHRTLLLFSRFTFVAPLISFATESYVYVARKNSN